MNSWKSTLLSAWAPPLSTFIIGTGSTSAPAPPRWRQSGSPASAAAALATASETPRIALAPSRDLFGGAVELDQASGRAPPCSAASGADERLGDVAVDVRDRLRDALARPGVAAVAQLGRLELAGRGARRHRGAAAGAGVERHLDLDRRVAPRVEDLARVYALDRRPCSVKAPGPEGPNARPEILVTCRLPSPPP